MLTSSPCLRYLVDYGNNETAFYRGSTCLAVSNTDSVMFKRPRLCECLLSVAGLPGANLPASTRVHISADTQLATGESDMSTVSYSAPKPAAGGITKTCVGKAAEAQLDGPLSVLTIK